MAKRDFSVVGSLFLDILLAACLRIVFALFEKQPSNKERKNYDNEILTRKKSGESLLLRKLILDIQAHNAAKA